MSDRIYDLLIIGNGPAGIGAAIQSNLYGLKVQVVGDGPIGGRLALARRVENFPGLSAGRCHSGLAICRQLERWLKARRILINSDLVKEVKHKQGLFTSPGRCGKTYLSRSVIVATGVRPKKWKVIGRSESGGRIVGNWRQVARPRGACVAVIGGGEVAFDQALSLAERGAEVLLLMRGLKPRAYPRLVAEAVRMGIVIIKDMPVSSVRCDARGVVLEAEAGRRYCCDYVLPAVGHRPQLPVLDRDVKRARNRGLWLAGDVREDHCRQAAIAFGDGVRASMLAWEFLRKGSV